MTRSIERKDMPTSDDYRYDPDEGPRDRSLRVGDKERDAVGAILRRGHVEGRLDTDEFQARLERCMTAKTYAGLDELIADFPRERAERRLAGQSWRPRPWPVPLLLLLLPLAVIAAISTGGHFAWLAVPLFLFFVVRPLVWRARGGGYARGSWACGPRRSTRV
jgi:uncharacterized protein DUF1707